MRKYLIFILIGLILGFEEKEITASNKEKSVFSVASQEFNSNYIASDKNRREVEEHCKNNLPKLWKEIKKLKDDGVGMYYSSSIRGPGKAQGTNKITINQKFILNKNLKYPEDRMIMILFHE